jgi:hypothetical protein
MPVTTRAARRFTPTRSRATSQCSSAACAACYQHCKEKHVQRYLAEFDFRYNNRSALNVEDKERATKTIVGARGKRLTYRQADRSEAAEAEG